MNLEHKLDKEISALLKRSNSPRYNARKHYTYKDFFSDKMLMIAAIRTGIPYSLFDLIQHFTPFSEADWAKFLDISTKSLSRYKQGAKSFRLAQSEKIVELAEVTKAGIDVFGDMEKLRLWLNTPNFALGNSKPIEFLKDSYGKELVMGELTRINYGILV